MAFNKFEKRQSGPRFGGGKPFGGKRFGNPSDGPRQMYPAICSQCGKSCEVPFKPTGDRPIYCNNCFKNQAGPDARFSGKPSFDRPRPAFGGQKPQFGGTQSQQGGSGGGVSKAQFESLNAKLDRIIGLLSGNEADFTPKKMEIFAKAKTEAEEAKGKPSSAKASEDKKKKKTAKKAKAKKP